MGKARFEPSRSPGLHLALRLARQGWPVFPLRPGTKEPLAGSRGFLDASTEESQVRHLFLAGLGGTGAPDLGVGVRCASRAGFCVDLDVKPGRDGVAAFRELMLEHQNQLEFPHVWLRYRTRSGGQHIIFETPADRPEVHTGADVLGPGIDLRGPRGYRAVYDPTRPDGYRRLAAFPFETGDSWSDWPTPAPPWLLDDPRLFAPAARAPGTEIELPQGDMCRAVIRASDPEKFDFTDHHSTARRIQHLALLGQEGHPGVLGALVELRPLYVLGRNYKTALDSQPRDPESDFDRMVEGALSKGTAAPAGARPDPCLAGETFARRFL